MKNPKEVYTEKDLEGEIIGTYEDEEDEEVYTIPQYRKSLNQFTVTQWS